MKRPIREYANELNAYPATFNYFQNENILSVVDNSTHILEKRDLNFHISVPLSMQKIKNTYFLISACMSLTSLLLVLM